MPWQSSLASTIDASRRPASNAIPVRRSERLMEAVRPLLQRHPDASYWVSEHAGS